jgi:capsular polysaccharide biosynthesis protein
MAYSVDGWTEGPGLPQSVWRYKWLVGGLALLGILIAALFSAIQPTQYEGVVPIFVSAEEGSAADPERTVASHAQFIESPIVLDRVIALTGNRLTRKDLEKQLKVEPSATGDFITIRARDATPVNAAELADAVDLAYRQILSEQRQAAANQTIEVLQAEQGRLASEIEQIQKQRRIADTPTLDSTEQAKRQQLDGTANKIEETSANAAGPPPALQAKAAVLDDPVQPKPLLTAAMGAVVGLVIGVALAWFLAARQRVMRSKETVESQAHVDAHASQESPEQVGQLAEVDGNRVMGSVGQAANSLDKDPDLLYSLAEWLESQHRNFPQITAERLRDRLLFDRVAVLLKTDGGLDLAGCVGWHPDGVKPVRHDDRRILNKLGSNGVRRIGSADRRALINAGLLGNDAQTIVVAPLKHENVAFGVLLVGQEEPDSEAAANGNGGFDGIGSFARSVAPDLHAWLLLHKLQEQLASHGKAKVQTTRPSVVEPASAVSEAPSAPSVPPPARSIQKSGASRPPAAPQPAESAPGHAESALPTAKSSSPATESSPPTAKPSLPAAQSGPPAAPQPAESALPTAKPGPPAAQSGPPAAPQPAESALPTAKPGPPATQSGPPTAPQPAESAPGRAESALPATGSSPPAAESGPPATESGPPAVWPTYPAEPEPSSTPENQPQRGKHRVGPR